MSSPCSMQMQHGGKSPGRQRKQNVVPLTCGCWEHRILNLVLKLTLQLPSLPSEKTNTALQRGAGKLSTPHTNKDSPLINVIGRLKKDWHQQIKSKGTTAPRLLEDSRDYWPNPYNGKRRPPSFPKPSGFPFEVLVNLCFSIFSSKVINKSDYEVMHPQSSSVSPLGIMSI